MFVLTADQRNSTTTGERVDALLGSLAGWHRHWADAVALPLERTVGDEVQVALTDSAAVVDLALVLLRDGDWSVGIGAGDVRAPLGPSARSSSGPAFVNARHAVERARGRAEPVPVVVAGDDPDAARSATAVLQLLGAVIQRRSGAGWEVADLLAGGTSQRDAATALGISPQAVSQRVAAALIEEERRARPVVAHLLDAVTGPASGPGDTVAAP
jgi:hypothetical protein